MRIISQDGMIDVPYEQVVIQRFDTEIYFINKNLTGVEYSDDMKIASYSTETKAQKAMEMLREFRTLKSVEGIPLTKAMDETFFNSIEKYFDYYVRSNKKGDILVLDFVKICDYFQFPADEDVEV